MDKREKDALRLALARWRLAADARYGLSQQEHMEMTCRHEALVSA